MTIVLAMVLTGSLGIVPWSSPVRGSDRVEFALFSEDNYVTGRGAFFFDPRVGEPNLPPELRAEEDDSGAGFYIVQFGGPIQEGWVQRVQSLGVAVLDYLPNYAFVVEASRALTDYVRELPYVRWVGVYNPAYKLSPALIDLKDGVITIAVSVFPTRAADRVVATIALSGGVVADKWTDEAGTAIVALVPTSLLFLLARLPEVSWLEPVGSLGLMNDNAAWVLQAVCPRGDGSNHRPAGRP